MEACKLERPATQNSIGNESRPDPEVSVCTTVLALDLSCSVWISTAFAMTERLSPSRAVLPMLWIWTLTNAVTYRGGALRRKALRFSAAHGRHGLERVR